MTSIGDTLRGERLRRGWTLEQVAAEIKVKPRLLEAIEEDAFDRLPYAMLARSFVRQYAQAMCVDEQEAVEQVDRWLAEAASPPSAPDLKKQSQGIPFFPPLADIRNQLRRESSLAALVWVALACFACATIYTTWRRNWEVGAAETRVERRAQAQAESPAPPRTQDDEATLDKPNADAVYQVTPDPIRVLFTATEPVWISVRSDGTPIYTGTLQAQQSRQFEGAEKMMVTIGNAGGVTVTLNGKPVGPIGAAGEVRMLELAPGGAFLNKSRSD
jgi:cytoskeletal protein RodZ